jgi:hypothetical protein
MEKNSKQNGFPPIHERQMSAWDIFIINVGSTVLSGFILANLDKIAGWFMSLAAVLSITAQYLAALIGHYRPPFL